MLVGLIIACEVGFWVLLAGGLALRYLAGMPRLGAALLLCEPLLELVLLVVSFVDLKNGGEPSWRHGVAALYIGYTVGYGHYTVKWLDGHAAHRFAGGPKPPGSKYGKARAVHEWKLWTRTLAAAAVAYGLLQAGIWYVGDTADTGQLQAYQGVTLKVIGIQALIAATYTIWPRKAPADAADQDAELAETKR
ncbi:hypothetical protein QEZ40_002333 [Streptomyces katrae]|uniref:Integral membrane protein n=1 Tax=Streptomyces katrae TaxID=68223 RepID=A0ABT7GNX7_9ACTN|nr:hypothetical protein [Streptomyces katrae]MDK9494655.1 hypothetical protein [Streptomyces katrae]